MHSASATGVSGVSLQRLEMASARRKLFGDKVPKSLKSVDSKRLPPIDAAAKYNSYRVYLQIQIWVGNVALKPDDWG